MQEKKNGKKEKRNEKKSKSAFLFCTKALSFNLHENFN
jgi:hypothetical protein